MTKFSLLICLSFLSKTLFSQSVVYGERSQNLPDSLLASSLFFDKNGWIYPNFHISDENMSSNNNSLFEYYQSISSAFWKDLCFKMSVSFQQDSIGICKFNDFLMNEKVTQLQRKYSEFSSFIFNIHGFRKKFTSSQNDVTSIEEFTLFRKKAMEYLISDPVIDVYWDGNYDCCFGTDFKKNKSLFELFEKTRENELKVAKNLSKLIGDLEFKQIRIVGHSLGGKLAFDCARLISNIQLKKLDKLTVVMIAPAAGNEEVLEQLITWEKQLRSLDKYGELIQLHIFYNRKDFALRKKDNKILLFGPGSKKYGPTDFGCKPKKNELIRLFAQLPMIHSMHFYNCTELGKKHSYRFYLSSDFSEEIFQCINS
jgi:hypothetical protein